VARAAMPFPWLGVSFRTCIARALVKKGDRFTLTGHAGVQPSLVAAAGLSALAAIEAFRLAGFGHGDIKPENVCVLPAPSYEFVDANPLHCVIIDAGTSVLSLSWPYCFSCLLVTGSAQHIGDELSVYTSSYGLGLPPLAGARHDLACLIGLMIESALESRPTSVEEAKQITKDLLERKASPQDTTARRQRLPALFAQRMLQTLDMLETLGLRDPIEENALSRLFDSLAEICVQEKVCLLFHLRDLQHLRP